MYLFLAVLGLGCYMAFLQFQGAWHVQSRDQCMIRHVISA